MRLLTEDSFLSHNLNLLVPLDSVFKEFILMFFFYPAVALQLSIFLCIHP